MATGKLTMTLGIKEVPIEESPYFAATTKKGKPYKKRQKELEKLKAAGITKYIVARFPSFERKCYGS